MCLAEFLLMLDGLVNDIGFKKLVYLLGLSSSSLIRNTESLFMFEVFLYNLSG